MLSMEPTKLAIKVEKLQIWFLSMESTKFDTNPTFQIGVENKEYERVNCILLAMVKKNRL